jgi:hypothetical protein
MLKKVRGLEKTFWAPCNDGVVSQQQSTDSPIADSFRNSIMLPCARVPRERLWKTRLSTAMGSSIIPGLTFSVHQCQEQDIPMFLTSLM